jgi:transposase
MVTRRKFRREFKLEALKLVTHRGVSAPQAAKDLDIHENVLRKWVRELREEPQEAFPGNGACRRASVSLVLKNPEFGRDVNLVWRPPIEWLVCGMMQSLETLLGR